MSAANVTNVNGAGQVFALWHSMLKMDASPRRFQWMQGLTEAPIACEKRRREWLARAGKGAHFAARRWDELPQSVRDALGAV